MIIWQISAPELYDVVTAEKPIQEWLQ